MDRANDVTSQLFDFINSLSPQQITKAIQFVDDNASQDKLFIRIREYSIERKISMEKSKADYF